MNGKVEHKEQIAQSLSELRGELASQPVPDEQAQKNLDALMARIQLQVDAEAHGEHSMLESLRELRDSLEASHPRATAIANELMVRLASIGI